MKRTRNKLVMYPTLGKFGGNLYALRVWGEKQKLTIYTFFFLKWEEHSVIL